MQPSDGEIRVVFRGARMVVIDKPTGLLSVPGKGPGKEDCAAARVRAWCAAEGMAFGGPLVVHRLDMDTSGLMVFGLDPDAQRELSRQFEAREVEKRYIALVEGIVERDAGMIDAPIRLEPAARPFRVVDEARGQPATTRWRVLAREIDRTRVEFEPLTGRTHQLRVHSALPAPRGLGHAIVGDVLYGEEGQRVFAALMGTERFTAEARRRGEEGEGGSGMAVVDARGADAPRLMLHASWLRVCDPGSGSWMEVASGAPF